MDFEYPEVAKNSVIFKNTRKQMKKTLLGEEFKNKEREG